jgi:hypothetical protein
MSYVLLQFKRQNYPQWIFPTKNYAWKNIQELKLEKSFIFSIQYIMKRKAGIIDFASEMAVQKFSCVWHRPFGHQKKTSKKY